MSKKDFQRGIEAAASANQDFMRKQAKATEALEKRIVQKIDDLGNVIDVVVDDLGKQELERLYSIKSELDPEDLDESERKLLVSLLYTLMMRYNQNNEQQKEYFYYIKAHLKVANPSADCDLQSVENIDSLGDTKIIYYIVCEFMFLGFGNHSYKETFEEFFECFYVKPKEIAEIEDRIDSVYNVMGVEGLVRHFDMGYKYIDEEETAFDDSDAEAGDEGVRLDPDHIAVIARGLENANLEKIKLGDSNIDDDAVFSRKDITVTGTINCSGNLRFEECIIRYDNKEEHKILLGEGVELALLNCCIQESSFNRDGRKGYFIESGEDEETCDTFEAESVSIIGCYVKQARRLVSPVAANVTIRKNCFYHCYDLLWFGWTIREGNFCDNVIITHHDRRVSSNGRYPTNPFLTFNKFNEKQFEDIPFSIQNCVVIGDHATYYTFEFRKSSEPIRNCTFINNAFCAYVENEIAFGRGVKGVSICDSEFLEMDLDKDAVVIAANNSCIENCDFMNIRALEGEDDGHLSCGVISYCSDGFNDIKGCSFNGIALKDRYLMNPYESNKSGSAMVSFEECSFSNIKREKGDDIINYDFEDDLEENPENFAGLENVNCEGERIENLCAERKKRQNKHIGANIPEDMPTNYKKYVNLFASGNNNVNHTSTESTIGTRILSQKERRCCPKCGSDEVKKITTTATTKNTAKGVAKATATAAFVPVVGAFLATGQIVKTAKNTADNIKVAWECKACGHKF